MNISIPAQTVQPLLYSRLEKVDCFTFDLWKSQDKLDCPNISVWCKVTGRTICKLFIKVLTIYWLMALQHWVKATLCNNCLTIIIIDKDSNLSTWLTTEIHALLILMNNCSTLQHNALIYSIITSLHCMTCSTNKSLPMTRSHIRLFYHFGRKPLWKASKHLKLSQNC